jgi:hypothetical protein
VGITELGTAMPEAPLGPAPSLEVFKLFPSRAGKRFVCMRS